MNQFNSVFFNLIDHQLQPIICDTGFSRIGQAIQLLYNVATNGIVIIRFQMEADSFVQIIKFR